MLIRSFVAITLLTTVAPLGLAADVTTHSKGEQLFALQIKPLLAAKCLACHGDDRDEIQGELDLTSRERMLAGGETSDQVLVPGKAEQSLLYVATTWKDPDLEMPPKENDRLTQEQTWFIRDWINEGAPWPNEETIAAIISRHEAEGVLVKTSGGLSEAWTNRRYKPADLWAYQPLWKDEGGRLKVAGKNLIDVLIDEKLEDLGLTAAPPADRRTLIRRVTYDLTGLPPTPDEVAAFVNDAAAEDEALAKVVDRLLDSPHYGEQWGRHWLDVVRYADSSGFANDYERGNTWRYRDYVIRSFNDDKPYDQFIREQVAGDEIDPNNPEMLVAAGFLRMGPWELTGMEVAKVARQRFLDDVTDMIGQVFLSHPLQCAKCHDHKFDPIPTRDYYSIQAVFATTQLAERPAEFLPAENTAGFEEQKYLLDRKREFIQQLEVLNQKSIDAARAWYKENNFDAATFNELVEGAAGSSPIRQYDQIRNKLRQQGVPEEQVPPRHAGFAPEDYGMERIARKGIERLKWELERYEPIAFSVYSGRTPALSSVNSPLRMPADRMKNGELELSAILAGGDPFSPTIKVQPGALSVLGGRESRAESKVPDFPVLIEGRRRALADWLAGTDNPLVARSIANRIWQWHMGQGLAGNPNNFGATGKKPSHPELLDWLAGTFVEDGWSFKKMHRRIIMSQAYRRSTEHSDREALVLKDPEGTSYATFKPRRLTAEELRDSMLAASGELNRQLGGIPAKPEINLEAAVQPRMVMGTFASAWQPSPLPSQRHRRSVYALKIRGLRDPFMEVFNEPSPEFSCEARDASTVTPQVFSLFNSQITYDRALALAARIKNETVTSEEAIGQAFALAYGRSPSVAESNASLSHWAAMTERHRSIKLETTKPPREVLREAVEENTGEKFQFTERLNLYSDFVPDLKANDVDAETRGLAEVCLVLLNSNEFAYVY
ncbi:MAG: PSD1 and planctomycete cytochrome C domain-containing protein [Planctomycetota bacterium]|nr:PSD1 and planctomycete cytochrome C domain-containing protein [Planctomycetota bacterium]